MTGLMACHPSPTSLQPQRVVIPSEKPAFRLSLRKGLDFASGCVPLTQMQQRKIVRHFLEGADGRSNETVCLTARVEKEET